MKSISEEITSSEGALLDFLTFGEMKNVVDLLQLYSDVNKKVIEEGKNTSGIFVRFSEIMNEIVDLLKKLPLELDDKEYRSFKNLPIFQH